MTRRFIRSPIGCAPAAIAYFFQGLSPIWIARGAPSIGSGEFWPNSTIEAGAKLVIIGHSLGGIYARELARRYPDKVEQIILLGSPIHAPLEHANPYLVMVARLTRRLRHHHDCDLETICGINGSAPPPGVRETVIYSKSDGIVDWPSCIEQGPNVETVEVAGTHVGLPYNLANPARDQREDRVSAPGPHGDREGISRCPSPSAGALTWPALPRLA